MGYRYGRQRWRRGGSLLGSRNAFPAKSRGVQTGMLWLAVWVIALLGGASIGIVLLGR